ncbi:MAG: thioredoxin domain-containing protein [Chlamydiota bacterium]|nr:thioredoxin domain-containing protein [Chlamydiota bacterium]
MFFLCFKKWNNLFVAALLLVGLSLTVLSYFQVCSSACTAVHDYRLFSFPFEVAGGVFFVTSFLLLIASFRWCSMRVVLIMLAAYASGAEIFLILFQKYVIKSWCPVCLSIAVVVFLILVQLVYSARIWIMPYRLSVVVCVPMLLLGFLVSSSAIAKKNSDYRELFNEEVILGNSSSEVEVYFFSDWMCPSCQRVESEVEGEFEELFPLARVCFVDLAINSESMYYLPYNLSFMINSKDHYIELRKALRKFADNKEIPTQKKIQKVVETLEVKYDNPLGYREINEGRKHFKALAKKFKVSQTPTVIIRNSARDEEVRLVGYEEISQQKITYLVSTLSK